MSQAAVDAVELSVGDLRAVLGTLDDADWAAPSGCAGWRVQDLVAHLSSNLKGLVEPPPAQEPPPGLKAEQLMELLVEPRKAWAPGQVHEEFERYAGPAVATLRAMQDEPVASNPVTLAELGTWPAHQLAEAFAFDVYCHLRSDLLAPRGPLRRSVPDPDDGRLGPVITWMLLGLPQMCATALAFLDRPVALRLDGPGGGTWTVVPGPERLGIADGAEGAAVTLRSTSAEFVDWGTCRTAWRDHVTLDGDEDLGTRFCDALDII